MIEIIAVTPEDARRIEACGADRIELVSGLSEGGLTTSFGMIRKIASSSNLPVNVIIRPHARSFVYTPEEIEIMKEDILMAKELGANGVVFGALTADGAIDESVLEQLLQVCGGLQVTFHRAIDELVNPVAGIKILAKYPEITTVLTSGGAGNIANNLPVLQEMVQHAEHIQVMPGGGLNFDNIEQIMEQAGVQAYHFGTVVRDGRHALRGINEENLQRLVKIIKRGSDRI